MQREDVILVGIATAVALLVAEAALRGLGSGPWRPFDDLSHTPVMASPDPALGWTNRPGAYRYDDGARPVQVTIGPDRARVVPGPAGDRATWLMGGSFVFGFGLSDDDTIAARLQATRPDLALSNLAVPGWGTVQSAGWFDTHPGPVEHVVYGLVDLHDARNAAAWAWLHALDRSGSTHAWKAVPSVWWDGTTLHRRPPRAYRHWSLSEDVALVDLGERAWLRLWDRYEGRKSEATVQCVLAWRDAVAARDATLTVVLLHAPRRAEYYLRRLHEEGMPLHDLRDPDFPASGALPDGHPDAGLAARWANQLAALL